VRLLRLEIYCDVLFSRHLDPTFEIFSLKFGLTSVGEERPESRLSSSLGGKLRVFRNVSISRQLK